jgi:hypothetical protein
VNAANLPAASQACQQFADCLRAAVADGRIEVETAIKLGDAFRDNQKAFFRHSNELTDNLQAATQLLAKKEDAIAVLRSANVALQGLLSRRSAELQKRKDGQAAVTALVEQIQARMVVVRNDCEAMRARPRLIGLGFEAHKDN